MRILLALLISIFLSACKSAPLQLPYEMNCTPTSVTFNDLLDFGIQPAPDKVAVVRILRTTCPSCKSDLDKIAARFHSSEWKSESVQLILIGYKKPGMETRASFDAFVREGLRELNLPIEAVQMVWLNKSFAELADSKNLSGQNIFKDWRAVPYGMVFAKSGRLVFRGQFTMTPEIQDEHYQVITRLQRESCKL